MALSRKDRISDTTATTGTGSFTLLGASPAGFLPMSTVVDGDTIRYEARTSSEFEWEIGEGVVSSSGTVLSRVRVFASSNAGALVSFSAGTKTVTLVMTAEDARPNMSPDTRPTAPTPTDDEFDFGTELDTAGARFPGAEPWVWVNQGLATAVVTGGHLVLTAPGNTLAESRLVLMSAPDAAWKYRAKLTAVDGASANYYYCGIVARDSATGNFLAFTKLFTAGLKLQVQRMTTSTAGAAPYVLDAFPGTAFYRSFRQPIYLEIEKLGTNLIFRFSDVGLDGTFIPAVTEPFASHVANPNQIGFVSGSMNGTPAWGAWDWIRRVS